MCLCVRFAPRDEIADLWDRDRNLITIPDELSATTLYTLRAVRVVLVKLGIPQAPLGATCWCGEPIELLPAIPTQRTSNEVSSLGA